MSYDAILSGMERKRRPILVVVFDANFFEKTFKMAKCEAKSANVSTQLKYVKKYL